MRERVLYEYRIKPTMPRRHRRLEGSQSFGESRCFARQPSFSESMKVRDILENIIHRQQFKRFFDLNDHCSSSQVLLVACCLLLLPLLAVYCILY